MSNIPSPGTVTPTNADGCPTVTVCDTRPSVNVDSILAAALGQSNHGHADSARTCGKMIYDMAGSFLLARMYRGEHRDSVCGFLVQYATGAPASWVGVRQWVPNLLLTST